MNVFLITPTAIDRPDVMATSYAYNTPLSSSGNYASLFVSIVAATGDRCGLMMNGTLLSPSSFTPVGASLFSAARFPIKQGYGLLSHTNGRPFGAYLFGYKTEEVDAWTVHLRAYQFG